MGLNTNQRQNVVFFTGYEVEHTICYGKKTLFVVGTPDVDLVLEKAKQDSEIDHIYFGTSQSFNPKSTEDYDTWRDLILKFLALDYWVSLDFDVQYVRGVLESGYCEYSKFVPMISVKLPYIQLFNYNTTLKIDDVTWGATNPGVWTHQLHDLMDKTKYTYWDQYTKDTEV